MHSMMYIGKFFSNFKDFYNEINTATLTGAIDIIVVEQPDGSYNCSPFHVRFGKLGVLRSRQKVVDIVINGEPQDIHMKLGDSGEAFFVEELENDDDKNKLPEHLATSPIPVSELKNIFTVSGGVRRRSFDLGAQDLNEINDYTKRRNTADNENISSKTRERDFIQRQIGLGNLGVCEASTEDITLSKITNNCDFTQTTEHEDTTFKMDDLEIEINNSNKNSNFKKENSSTSNVIVINANNNTNNNNKNDNEVKVDKVKDDEVSLKTEEISDNSRSSNSKKKRRKTKKKNAPRKSSSITQLTSLNTNTGSLVENQDKTNDSATDLGSMDSSNSSEPEIKDLLKSESTTTVTSSTTRKIIDPDFHFFSDTELTTNANERCDSPLQIESVQSDSEFEVKNRNNKGKKEDNTQSWEWGGFPTLPINDSIDDSEIKEQPDHSVISNMFSFMKRNHGQNEGIYLSDLNSVDPEVAELYFTKKENHKTDVDMDCESGNGPSLAQSPNSAEGCKSIDSDFEEHIKRAKQHEISMSLCGWSQQLNQQRFNEQLVSFSDFCNDPSIIEHPNLVVQINGKFYNWKVAGPIISSLIVFNRPLVQSAIDQLYSIHMTTTTTITNSQNDKIENNIESVFATSSSAMETVSTATKQESRSWWDWRRPKTSRETTPTVEISAKLYNNDGSNKVSTNIEINANGTPNEPNDQQQEQELAEQEETQQGKEQINNNTTILPISPISSDKFRKTLRLSSSQIAKLNLRDGLNKIEFSVTTAYQGTSRCTCYLYKWKWDDKIVISDIDGTITRSDVLGHILPIVGKDWAQSGVAQLFNKIKDNGYKLLYLSARAIGQARITREYLKSIKQGDSTMPDGPILLNPTSLITAFHREVIEKKPEQFKISCMSDIKALFPIDSEPFYAGYGNRINDVWAYRAVGIPIVRIFTINPKGELKHELTQTFQSSYTGQSLVVNDVFPPILNKIKDNNFSSSDLDDDESDSVFNE